MQRAETSDVPLTHGVVVHYHEIGLKGRNRGWFEERLRRNLADAATGCDVSGIDVLYGRLIVRTPGPPSETLLDRVSRVFGIAAFGPCVVVRPELDAISAAAIELLEHQTFGAFAIAARRATKTHAFTSKDVNVVVGRAVQDATGAAVNLGSPDVTVHVEVVGHRALVYTDRRTGPGGLPVGVSGRVVSLLSGGIDSPVATYRICKRGAKAILCHFHSAPFTDLSSARKAETLAALVAAWQGRTTLHIVPLGEAQRTIVGAARPALRVVLYRRLMVRIAAELAVRSQAGALVTGDSLGQVASQTLENISCVDDASPLPVLRPLIGWDKQEIIAEAQRIGTFETSILPYADCCSLFVPKSPATRATVEECREAERGLDIDGLIAGCLAGADIVRTGRDVAEAV